MISLSCLKDVYIGPTITPSIWVHSGNKKLFPKFREENVIYLNVETLDPTQNSSNCILSAQILPKDSFVRKFVEDIGQPSLMESAYIIPLMARFMKQLSFEANFFNKLLLDVSYKKRICKKLLRTIENYKERLRKICYSDVNSINMVHKYRREIEDSYEFISILSTNKIKQKYEEILNIFDDYNEFCSLQMQCEQLSGLSGNIYRLLELPIQVFLKNLDHEASLKHNVILEKVIDVTKEEYKMFERLLGI